MVPIQSLANECEWSRNTIRFMKTCTDREWYVNGEMSKTEEVRNKLETDGQISA